MGERIAILVIDQHDLIGQLGRLVTDAQEQRALLGLA